MPTKRGLGKGFDALIPTAIEPEFDPTAATDQSSQRPAGDAVLEAGLDQVKPNPHQPRQQFDADQLTELADSIKRHGILQPLVVTKSGRDFELIAGERRLRAAKLAGLAKVPVIVRSYDEQQKLELALIENLQRQDLNPIETATAYRKLIDQFNLSLDDLSRQMGRDNSTVSNTMRLLNLPIEAKRAIASGKITEGHGRAILALTEPEKQLALLELILKKQWTVRQAEAFARDFRGQAATKDKALQSSASDNDLTRQLSTVLGTKVTTQPTAKGGRLIIEYYSDEELQRIYDTIKG